MHKLCEANAEHPAFKDKVAQLAKLNQQWGEMVQQIGMAAMKNPDEVGAASVDFLMFSGYVALAYFWLQMALVAERKLAEGSSEKAFYESKLMTCDFYFKRILPRTAAHQLALAAGSECMMQMTPEHFAV